MTDTDYRSRLYARYRSAPPAGRVLTVEREMALRSSHLRRVVRRYFPADRQAAVFELGCGAGLLLAAARQAGYVHLAGVDGSAEQVAAARAQGLAGVGFGDLAEGVTGLAPASQDLIVAWDVLEHIRRDELLDLVDGVWRALKPGGRWLIHVPNGESPFFGRIQYGDLTHETVFTRVSLGQVLRASGFARVTCREERPAHPLRYAAWLVLRSLLRAWVLLETGDRGREAVFTQTMVAVAVKDADPCAS